MWFCCEFCQVNIMRIAFILPIVTMSGDIKVVAIYAKASWPEEAVVTSKNGVLVEVDNVEAFTPGAASILSLSDASWREMSPNAYDTVASSSCQESTGQFEMALQRALAT